MIITNSKTTTYNFITDLHYSYEIWLLHKVIRDVTWSWRDMWYLWFFENQLPQPKSTHVKIYSALKTNILPKLPPSFANNWSMKTKLSTIAINVLNYLFSTQSCISILRFLLSVYRHKMKIQNNDTISVLPECPNFYACDTISLHFLYSVNEIVITD